MTAPFAGTSGADYKDALRHLAGGVSIVTTRRGGERHGMTVSAFVSVSAEPPMVAVVIDRRHSINRLLANDPACFAVSILGADQQALADRFASVRDQDRFLVGRWQEALTGAPVLADALAWLDCTVAGRQRAGSHTIFLGAVRGCGVARADAPPLVYWNRAYRGLAKPRQEPERVGKNGSVSSGLPSGPTTIEK